MNYDFYLILLTKNITKWFKELHVTAKSKKHLQEITEVNLCVLQFGNAYIAMNKNISKKRENI